MGTRMDETGRSLIPKRFRIEFLGRRREFITLLGGAAAWPITARAQAKLPTIGVLVLGSPPSEASLKGLRDRPRDVGYTEDHNIRLEIRNTEGKADLLTAAKELHARAGQTEPVDQDSWDEGTLPASNWRSELSPNSRAGKNRLLPTTAQPTT